ncbi:MULTISPECIES: hypothetical protein [unclassified Agarivorans]|uniref:hypothetical protein n=1 Tax=unclassified Agarivorans TaxID=2636026 RepID=UPI0026E32955|nr:MULTISPECIES: hypothetical protein [unclassified Agarivorans]MDO6683865.1 hypothetical protein [Agarivorans sp. 3_MG-2023]MDO6714402.1 hypothetical protein [Agarivorans sp. 2_MG-2023]
MTEKNLNDEELISWFPPLASTLCFLLVTLLTMIFFGSSMGNWGMLDIAPELVWGVGAIFMVIFCVINFRITRGSFRCKKLLQLYVLTVIIVSLPLWLTYDPFEDKVRALLQVFTLVCGLLVLKLTSSKTYQAFIQFQYDAQQSLKAVKLEVEQEIQEILKSMQQGK